MHRAMATFFTQAVQKRAKRDGYHRLAPIDNWLKKGERKGQSKWSRSKRCSWMKSVWPGRPLSCTMHTWVPALKTSSSAILTKSTLSGRTVSENFSSRAISLQRTSLQRICSTNHQRIALTLLDIARVQKEEFTPARASRKKQVDKILHHDARTRNRMRKGMQCHRCFKHVDNQIWLCSPSSCVNFLAI